MIKIKPFALLAITVSALIVVLIISSLPYGKFSAVNGVWAQQYGPPPSANLIVGTAGLGARQGRAVGHLIFNMDQAFTFKPFNIPLNHLVVYRLTPAGGVGVQMAVARNHRAQPGAHDEQAQDGAGAQRDVQPARVHRE